MDTKKLRSQARNQICVDLKKLLKLFIKEETGIRILAKKMNLSPKTLQRILQKNNDPRLGTLISFYSYFFNIQGITETSNKLYQSIIGLIEKENSSYNENKEQMRRLNNMLTTDRVVRTILIYAATGPISKNWVRKKFGENGLEILKLLTDENILMQRDKEIYSQGDYSKFSAPESIKSIISELVEAHFTINDEPKTRGTLIDLLHNYEEHLNVKIQTPNRKRTGFFMLEGVTEETRQILIKKIIELEKEFIQIVSDPKSRGDIRLFIVGLLDPLTKME